MNRCHSPYIVKFKSYQFIIDEDNTEYVVMEFEKCLTTHTDFLSQQTQENQISNETKMRLA